ncbi:hypothetical protein AAHH79_37860, partial [Burkholderia pseudomallei]
ELDWARLYDGVPAPAIPRRNAAPTNTFASGRYWIDVEPDGRAAGPAADAASPEADYGSHSEHAHEHEQEHENEQEHEHEHE